MYVYIYVCIYIYMYVHMCIYTYGWLLKKKRQKYIFIIADHSQPWLLAARRPICLFQLSQQKPRGPHPLNPTYMFDWVGYI